MSAYDPFSASNISDLVRANLIDGQVRVVTHEGPPSGGTNGATRVETQVAPFVGLLGHQAEVLRSAHDLDLVAPLGFAGRVEPKGPVAVHGSVDVLAE